MHKIYYEKFLFAAALLTAVLSNARVSKATLTASGLTCSMCSKAIYEALQKVNTIESMKANTKESGYSIIFKNQAKVSFAMNECL